MLTRREFIRNALTGLAVASAPAVLVPERKIWAVPAAAPVPDRSGIPWIQGGPYDGQALFGVERSVDAEELFPAQYGVFNSERIVFARRRGVITELSADDASREQRMRNNEVKRQIDAIRDGLARLNRSQLSREERFLAALLDAATRSAERSSAATIFGTWPPGTEDEVTYFAVTPVLDYSAPDAQPATVVVKEVKG